jgi:Na+/H+ antiporter NhaA
MWRVSLQPRRRAMAAADPRATEAPAGLPLVHLARPLDEFLRTEAGSAGLLLGATVFALLWANSPWSDSYTSLWATDLVIRVGDHELNMDLHHWVNDGLMALFFFVMGLEVRRELSVGELTQPRRVVIPAVGAIGGIIVPALLFLAINPGGDAAHGWGVVIGTDTAFLLGALTLVGPAISTQLRVLLLTMTVFDDLIAVAVIGLVYSDSIDVQMVGIALACLAALALLDRFGAWRTTAYALIVVGLWLAIVESGLHPTIAGMTAGLMIAARPPKRESVEEAASLFRAFRESPLPSVGYDAKIGLERAVSVNERLQLVLHGWTSLVIVPIFAVANAGVDLRGGLLGEALRSPITWGVVVGLTLGKLLGISVASLVVSRLRLGALPQGVGNAQVVGGAALSGIGFTVSLLIAGLAFNSQQLRDEAIVGVLIAAVVSVAVGWLAFRIAAVVFGETSATLPLVLDRPVDPKRDHIRGRMDAPMTLVEYGDFECPFCGEATGVLRQLQQRFGDDLRYVFRHLPLTAVHPHGELAAIASEAADAQGRFWEMHDVLFQNQTQLEFEDLLGYAGGIGLDVEKFARAMRDERLLRRVEADVRSAEASGARGTQTFFIGDRRHLGPFDARSLAAALSGPAVIVDESQQGAEV